MQSRIYAGGVAKAFEKKITVNLLNSKKTEIANKIKLEKFEENL